MKKGLSFGVIRQLPPLYRAFLSSFLSAVLLSLCTIVVFAAFSVVTPFNVKANDEEDLSLFTENLVSELVSENVEKADLKEKASDPEQPEALISFSDLEGESFIASYELSLPERELLVATLDTLLEEEDCMKVNSLIRSLLAGREENKSTSSVESVHRGQNSSFPVTRHSVFLNSPQSLPALRKTLESHLGSSCVIEESRLSKTRQLIQIYQYDVLCAEVLCIENYDPIPEKEGEEPVEDIAPEPEAIEEETVSPEPVEVDILPKDPELTEVQQVPEEESIELEDPEESAEDLIITMPDPEEKMIEGEGEAVGEQIEEAAVSLPEESAVIPVSEETEVPRPEPSFPETDGPEAKLAIIIDDGGYFKEETDRILALHFPLTLAILPDTPIGDYVASEGLARGFETILHMPMQSSNGRKNHFPGELNVSMTREEIQDRTRECLALYPGIVGVNNHTGGLFTSCCEPMRHFMDVVREEGIYFVDSVTIAKSCAFTVAIEMHVPCAKRDIFLDHDNQLSEVRRHFHLAVDHAKQHGSCIAIGHFRKNTVAVLEQELPLLKNKGVRIVPVSELIW